jgi:peptidoglycan/LPS O-acetylase OafA/YrhL
MSTSVSPSTSSVATAAPGGLSGHDGLNDHSGGFVREHISRVPYLPGLDGMRAIAVVAVMVYHANTSWLPGGFLGVEMFFVISGYLITLLMIAERERNYRVSLRDFWFRRARRLLPALFVLLTLLTIWTALFERDALGQLRGDVISSFFYVSNWYQIWVGQGYTSAGDFAPLRHLWSLAVEEQFYLIWPLVMIAFLGRSGTRRIANFSRWLFAGAIVVTIIVGLLYYPGPIGEPSETPEAYWFIGDRPIAKLDTLYLSTVGRAGGLMLGSAFAMIWRPFAIVRGPLRNKGRAFDVLSLLAFVGFGWMCWNIHLVDPSGADGRLFRGGLFVAGVLTLIVIAAVTHRGSIANRVLGGSVLLWIGTRSYGLYLYHWPIYQIIRNVAGNSLRFHEFVLAMIPTVILTEASYRFIETPIRKQEFGAMFARRSPSTTRPRTLLISGAAVAGALSLFAGGALVTAELRQNDIAESLNDGEDFTTDLATRANKTGGGSELTLPPTVPPVAVLAPATTVPATTVPATIVPATIVPATTIPVTTLAAAATKLPPVTTAAPPSTEAPATTSPPPPPTDPPAPVTQLGVVTDLSVIQPLTIPPTETGLPLVALGDSVMLGAAEELQSAGFFVDAAVSRQMVAFLPDMQIIRDDGNFGPVVVVHLGTNGPFSQTTLDQMMAVVAGVPRVLVLTGKGDRDWIAGNNAKIRALPATYPSVTVIDWEVLSAGCPGDCFYDDGIHLPQTGQNFYADVIKRVLGLA